MRVCDRYFDCVFMQTVCVKDICFNHSNMLQLEGENEGKMSLRKEYITDRADG